MKLKVENNLGWEEKKINLLAKFCLYCNKKLGIKEDYEIFVISDRSEHGIKTTAHYQQGDKIIKVYGKNRSLADIARSIAHEMTHMRQDLRGEIKGPVQDIGGYHEDQANAFAGSLIKMFIRDKDKDREIFESKLLKKLLIKC